MRFGRLILWLFLIWARPVWADPLSVFAWDETAQTEGLRISGAISWAPKACDFRADQKTHAFPLFSYKKPSGKPLKDPNGSYCLRLDIPPDQVGQTLSISMIRLFGNAEFLINNQRVWHQDDNTGPQRLAVLYDVRDPEIYLELRLTCNQAPSCGFRGGLHIENQRQGTRKELMRYSYDFLAIMGGLSCFFYHIIFAFLRRRSSAALFLAFNALSLILRIALTGQGQIQYFIPWTEGWYWRFETLAVFILLPSTLSLVRSVFEEDTPDNLSTLGWVISLCGMAFMVFNARIFIFILVMVYAVVLLNIFAFILVSKRAWKNDRSGALILIFCSLINVVSTLLEVLNARLNIEMHPAVQPLSYLTTMIFQSVLLATRINDAFVLAEHQETEIKSLKQKIEFEILSLDQKIVERTAELRTIFQSISTGILWISTNERQQLEINSEYSEHLRETIGFDIQSWHEMHFFLRRLSLPDLPKSGRELATWFHAMMANKDKLDAALEQLLGGLRIFNDLERIKHLKFKWVTIVDEDRISEVFLFVFDVSLSMEMQAFALYKSMEIEALRELTAQAPDVIDNLHEAQSPAALQDVASQHSLRQLEHALTHPQSEASRTKFMQAYRRVLNLLHERQNRNRQQKTFDLATFLHLPDWRNLPVDARGIFQDLLKNRKN